MLVICFIYGFYFNNNNYYCVFKIVDKNAQICLTITAIASYFSFLKTIICKSTFFQQLQLETVMLM